MVVQIRTIDGCYTSILQSIDDLIPYKQNEMKKKLIDLLQVGQTTPSIRKEYGESLTNKERLIISKTNRNNMNKGNIGIYH